MRRLNSRNWDVQVVVAVVGIERIPSSKDRNRIDLQTRGDLNAIQFVAEMRLNLELG